MKRCFVVILALSSISLFGAQKKDHAVIFMEVLLLQRKMEAQNNKKIASVLEPYVSQEECKKVNAYFKEVRAALPKPTLAKITEVYCRKNYSGAWELVTADLKKALFNYYQESSSVMKQAKERAAKANPDFVKLKEYELIEKMLAVYDLTIKMLEIAAKD